MSIIDKVISKVENMRVPLWLLILIIVAVGSLTGYLEYLFFNYHPASILSFLQTSCSYYIMMFMFVLLSMKVITGEKIEKITSALSVAVPVILLPPIIDRFVFNRSTPYLQPTPQTWANMALSFLQSNPESYYHGHQVAFGILIIMMATYIYAKIKNLSVIQRISIAISSTFTLYIMIMAISTPEIWPIYHVLYCNCPSDYFAMEYRDIAYNFVYVVLASVFFWLAIIVENPKKVEKLMEDASPPRILHFSLMYVLGFFVQLNFQGLPEIYIRGNILTLLVGILSAASGWAFVVAINNYYDKKDDEITNSYRGLASGKYTDINIKEFMILALVTGAYTALVIGETAFLIYILFTFLGFLYSYPKIYLKKYGTKTIIIGLGSSLLFAMGYFSPWYPNLTAANMRFWIYFIVLFIAFSAGSVMNDLKDVESDRKRGTITIFTVFEKKNGKIAAAGLLSIAFSLPAVLAPRVAIAFFALAAIGAFFLFKEKVKYIYLVYFSEYFLILLFHTL